MSGRDRDDEDLPLSQAKPVDEDVRRELEFHIEQRAAELVAAGYAPDAARATAREVFGDAKGVAAECREIEQRRRTTNRRARRWAAFRQDVVVGWRMLRRRPAFTAAALATLAIGVGATTAVFSIMNQVLLRPLPYHDPDRLVDIVERTEQAWATVTWANFLDIEASSRSFVAMASVGAGPSTVLGADIPLRTMAATVSKGFFGVFPVVPALGRLPLPEEHERGAPPVAVVSHAFWRDHLGAPRSLDGIRLRMREDHAVVGVLPPGFDYPRRSQVWVPMELMQQSMSRTSHNWDVVARLAPGVDPAGATRELEAILSRLATEYAPGFDATGAIVTPLKEKLTRSARAPLTLLLAASAMLLLTACSNLAGALMARGTARAGEMAIRSALGATRVRLVRQLLTETLLLSIGGGVAGVALATLLLRLTATFAPGTAGVGDIAVDGRVMAFTLLVVVATAALCGLLPAWRISEGGGTSRTLREGGRGTPGGGRIRAWNVLVAAEVALAVGLLAGSTLLMRSYMRVMDTRLGFDPVDATAAAVSLPALLYGDDSPQVAAFHARVLSTLQETPGVASVGFSNIAPLGGNNISGSLEVEGKPQDPRGPFNSYALYRVVGGEFFRAAGIPLIRGRTFEEGDVLGAPRVVVVNEAFANAEWAGQDPVGQRVRPYGMDLQDEEWATVIGVVGDVRSSSPIDRVMPTYYFDHRQRPPFRTRAVTYVVRSPLPPTSVSAVVRDAVRAADANVPVEFRTLQDVVSGAVSDRRFTMLVLVGFATAALVLAVIGIFAVVSYSVAQRTREIGVRIALGSTPGRVRGLVIGDAMFAVAPGLLVGGAITLASAGALRSLLYDVSPLDPIGVATAMATLALAAAASSLGPAVRATRIDPMNAIRGE